MNYWIERSWSEDKREKSGKENCWDQGSGMRTKSSQIKLIALWTTLNFEMAKLEIKKNWDGSEKTPKNVAVSTV